MLQNVDCNYIKVSSPTMNTVLGNIGSYQKAEVEVTKNCCASLVYNAEILFSDLNWNVKMFTAAQEADGIVIDSIHVKNILTGVEEVISLSYGYDTENCTLGFAGIEADITAWLTARGVIAFPTFSSSVDTNGVCIFSIQDMPPPFVLSKMVYTLNGSDYERYFTYSGTGTGLFISSNQLYISPAIINQNLQSFTDGIYTVTTTYIKKNGDRVIETSCLFVDCSIKCQVAAKIDTLTTDTLLHTMYFALLEASDCACQCDKMCKLYEQILIELGILNNTSDCGC